MTRIKVLFDNKPTSPKFVKLFKFGLLAFKKVSEIKNMKFKQRTLEPYFLVLPVTYRCNLSCVMCTCPQQAKEIGELDLNGIRQKLEELSKNKKYPVDVINLTGGELFLRKDNDDIVALLKEFGAKEISIACNCYDQEKTISGFKSMLDNYPEIKWHFMTSLDGTKEIHNTVRRNKKAYQNTIKTLIEVKKLQREYDFSISANTTVSPENIDNAKQVKDSLFLELGINSHYTYAVDSDLYINSQESKVADDLKSEEYIAKVKKFALQDYKENKDLFALDVYHMLNGKYRFSPCAFHYGGNFLEPSGKFFKCSITTKSYLPDLEDRTQKKVLAGIKKECGSCLNNCGNNYYSKGVFDYLQSGYIRNKTLYLATDKLDIFTAMALKKHKIKFVKYNGEKITDEMFVIYTKRSKYAKSLTDDGLKAMQVKVGIV